MSEEQNVLLEKWIEQVKEHKKAIAELKTHDRLAIVASISKLHHAIAGSLQGWLAWLRNPPVLDNLTEGELKETFETFKKLAMDFLDLDLKMSSAVLKKNKAKKKKKKKGKEKTTKYIT